MWNAEPFCFQLCWNERPTARGATLIKAISHFTSLLKYQAGGVPKFYPSARTTDILSLINAAYWTSVAEAGQTQMIRPVSPVPHLRKCFPVERDSPDPAAHKLRLGRAALPGPRGPGRLAGDSTGQDG